jgi:hypothetical protein
VDANVLKEHTAPPHLGLKCDASRLQAASLKNICIHLLYIQMHKFCFISINAIVTITESNVYRREIALYNQTTGKSATRTKTEKRTTLFRYPGYYALHHKTEISKKPYCNILLSNTKLCKFMMGACDSVVG